MLAHSSSADVVFLSMPIPDLETSAIDYMAWLQVLSDSLPPVVFIRGTNSNVLTFEL